MDKFTSFILQVMYPPNPIRNLDDSLTAGAASGQKLLLISSPTPCSRATGATRSIPSGTSSFFPARSRVRVLRHRTARSSFENEPQHLKIPHLRNMYQKVGMFGMPAVPFFNAGDNGFMGDQVRGFGFLHDGSTDTLFRFHNAVVFNQRSRQFERHSGGRPGDLLRRQLEAFMLAFDQQLQTDRRPTDHPARARAGRRSTRGSIS
jgi:hypothetical protein